MASSQILDGAKEGVYGTRDLENVENLSGLTGNNPLLDWSLTWA